MSEAAPREWRFYLDDMIGFCEKIIAYTDGLDQDGFVANGLNYDATLRNLCCGNKVALYERFAARRQCQPHGPVAMS